MKKLIIVLVMTAVLLSLLAVPAMADKGGKNAGCITLQDGVITYSAGHYLAGQPIPVGYDAYGYNYQAHMFNGYFPNVYLGRYGYPPYEGDAEAYLALYPEVEVAWYWYPDANLVMKWNDAWLSNMDCDGDGALDRSNPYIGSGAWETNHQYGSYEVDGETYKWNVFIKIVAVPEDAVLVPLAEPWIDSDGSEYNNMWYAADGTEIGPEIWGAFAIIQEVCNDQGTGQHGIYYNAPAPTGFGYYMP